jgi:hypothetical protein
MAIPQKLSIMDILEAHFLEKRTTSRLFFRVDLSEEIENCNVNIHYEEPNNSYPKSMNNKNMNYKSFKSNEMEDIIETTSLLEREKINSILEEESKLGEESLNVERSVKFDKQISSDSSRSFKVKKRIRTLSCDIRYVNDVKSNFKMKPKVKRSNSQID